MICDGAMDEAENHCGKEMILSATENLSNYHELCHACDN